MGGPFHRNHFSSLYISVCGSASQAARASSGRWLVVSALLPRWRKNSRERRYVRHVQVEYRRVADSALTTSH